MGCVENKGSYIRPHKGSSTHTWEPECTLLLSCVWVWPGDKVVFFSSLCASSLSASGWVGPGRQEGHPVLIGRSAALKILHDSQKHTWKIPCVFLKPSLHPAFGATNCSSACWCLSQHSLGEGRETRRTRGEVIMPAWTEPPNPGVLIAAPPPPLALRPNGAFDCALLWNKDTEHCARRADVNRDGKPTVYISFIVLHRVQGRERSHPVAVRLTW